MIKDAKENKIQLSEFNRLVEFAERVSADCLALEIASKKKIFQVGIFCISLAAIGGILIITLFSLDKLPTYLPLSYVVLLSILLSIYLLFRRRTYQKLNARIAKEEVTLVQLMDKTDSFYRLLKNELGALDRSTYEMRVVRTKVREKKRSEV